MGSLLGGWGQGRPMDMSTGQQNQQQAGQGPASPSGHTCRGKGGTSMGRVAISDGLPPPWESIGRPLVGRRGSQARQRQDEPPKSHLLIKDNSLIRIEDPVSRRQPLKASVFCRPFSCTLFLFMGLLWEQPMSCHLVLFSLLAFPQTLQKNSS